MDSSHFLADINLGSNLEDPDNGIRNDNKGVDVAYSRYEEKINDIVR